MRVTRRTFMKLSTAMLAGAPVVLRHRPALAQLDDTPVTEPTKRPFGRAIQGGLIIREFPSTTAKLIRNLKLNEVIPITGQIIGDRNPTTYNKIWYHTLDGWVHSAMVQPVEQLANEPLAEVDPNGFWGEITYPLTEARVAPDATAQLRYRFYYGTVFRVIAVVADSEGNPWYQIQHEYAGNKFFVNARHVRQVQPEELTPLSPDVSNADKRIEVDIAQQMTTAYEGSQLVFSARVATGTSFRSADGTVRNMRTIPGDHRIYMKMTSQHMSGGLASDNSAYDLPGVSWVSYFTASGIAFHTAYWHNDFGRPRSHGCVNMLPEDAKWLFRWTMPVMPYSERQLRIPMNSQGTHIKVF